MSQQETEWFEGLRDPMERCYWRRIGFLIFAALALAVIFGPLMGCATQKEADVKVCYMKLMGSTEEGYSVVAQHCVSAEEFQAAQK